MRANQRNFRLTAWHLVFAALAAIMLFHGALGWFKWLMAAGFLVDAARGMRIGQKIGPPRNEVTMAVAIIGMLVFKMDFVRQECYVIFVIDILFLLQTGVSWAEYGEMVSHHTLLARIAAVLQGLFLLALFFFEDPFKELFYAAAVFTIISLSEEVWLSLTPLER